MNNYSKDKDNSRIVDKNDYKADEPNDDKIDKKHQYCHK